MANPSNVSERYNVLQRLVHCPFMAEKWFASDRAKKGHGHSNEFAIVRQYINSILVATTFILPRSYHLIGVSSCVNAMIDRSHNDVHISACAQYEAAMNGRQLKHGNARATAIDTASNRLHGETGGE